MKRQGFKSTNAAGKTVSGGAFTADTKAESSLVLDVQLQPIDPDKAFKLVSEEFEGNESDWSETTTFKPSPETARRLRLMFDLPPGNAAGFTIEEYEAEMGDGWATDQREHQVSIEFKGETLLVLSDDDPMSRLRQRIAHSHRDLAAEAEEILELPDHERWVKLYSDRSNKPFPKIAKITEVRDDAIITKTTFGIEAVWPLSGDDGHLLRFSREEALAAEPNLAFTENDPAADAVSAISEALHAKWLERNPDPVIFTYNDYSSEEPNTLTVDARDMPLDELYVHTRAGFISMPRDEVAKYCDKMDHVPSSEELDAQAEEIAAKIEQDELTRERHYRRERPAAWKPTTDVAEIRELLDIVWDPYR